MDVLEFGKIRRRICKIYYLHQCKDCPLVNKRGCSIGIFCTNDEDDIRIVEIAEKWAKEHPAKTRQSEFLKLFPNTPIGDNGIIRMAPCRFGFVLKDGEVNITTSSSELCQAQVSSCSECCRKFWSEEIEE